MTATTTTTSPQRSTGMPKAELDLWIKYRATGSHELRDQLIERYAPIIKNVVARLPVHLPAHVDQDDLVGYGAVGLLEAIDRFDPALGIKFETFARKRIRGAALDAVRAQSALSRGTHERIRTISATYARLETELGRPAEDEEVAHELGVTTEELDQSAQLAAWEMLSLDQPLHTADGLPVSLGETLGDSSSPDPSEHAVHSDLLENLTSAVDRLPERERILLGLYYMEGLTMQEIAEIFHVTKPRICQIHNRALLRLRGFMESEGSP
ncbi:MAG: FliA/WhiG family RNA polymerase sigma factor [Chloroflexi bacterium]|nr:FliA/WhiG family RNA polymerase sigma factor [Chloroflexota bacterium]